MVAPARERGLKSCILRYLDCWFLVAPARERGLKSLHTLRADIDYGRSREGAWIEIGTLNGVLGTSYVAPARERGLKYSPC